MTSKKAMQLIKKALPGAKILSDPHVDGAVMVRSDAATPNADALLRKYGGASALTRSRSRKAADALNVVDAEFEEAIVQLKSTNGTPARLSRRTVTINKKTGKIESMSG